MNNDYHLFIWSPILASQVLLVLVPVLAALLELVFVMRALAVMTVLDRCWDHIAFLTGEPSLKVLLTRYLFDRPSTKLWPNWAIFILN